MNSTFYYNSDPQNAKQELDQMDLTLTYSTRGGHNIHTSFAKNIGETGGELEVGIGWEKSVGEDYGRIGSQKMFDEPLALYSKSQVPFTISYGFALFPNVDISPCYDFLYEGIDGIEPEHDAPEVPSVKEQDSYASGVGLSVSHKTTNKGIYKTRGHSLSASSMTYHRALGGSSDFEVSKLTLKQYLPLSPEVILGFHLQGVTAYGDVPESYLLSLGGNKLVRGFSSDKYKGRRRISGQTELRFPIWWRVGGTAFFGAGDVSDRIDDLGKNIRFASGLGIRLMVQTRQKINVRFDFAYNSDHDLKKYIKLKEAF